MSKLSDTESQSSGKRVAIYAYSASVQQTGSGMKPIKVGLQAAAHERGMCVVAEYEDTGNDREGLEGLLERAMNEPDFCDCVLVKDLRSFGRTTTSGQHVINTLQAHGVEVISMLGDKAVSDAGWLHREMTVIYSQMQSVCQSRRIKAALADKRHKDRTVTALQNSKIQCDACAGRGYHQVSPMISPTSE